MNSFGGLDILVSNAGAAMTGDAFVALAGPERTTAHVMTVDGGNIEAALR